MAYYWRATNIPELQGVQVADRVRWWRLARVRVWSRHAWWMGAATGLLIAIVVDRVSDRLHMHTLAGFLVFLAVAGVLDWLFAAYWLRPRARAWLQINLAQWLAKEQTVKEQKLRRIEGLEAFDVRRGKQNQGRL